MIDENVDKISDLFYKGILLNWYSFNIDYFGKNKNKIN